MPSAISSRPTPTRRAGRRPALARTVPALAPLCLCLCLALAAAPAPAQQQAPQAPQISARDMALGFYQPIAEQGEPYAQLTMGEIYRDGAGVPRDLIQAYAWFYVAAQQGVDEAGDNAAALWEEMEPNQRYQAEALGREFARLFIPQ